MFSSADKDKTRQISALSITAEMTESDKDARGTLWQVTIYSLRGVDVVDEESANKVMATSLPPGWKLYGQLERCPTTGRLHIQGHIKTPQVRWRAVQKEFKGCHFELARNRQALQNYDKKPDSRVAQLEVSEGIPSVWDYSEDVARRFPLDAFNQRTRELIAKDQFDPEKRKEIIMKLFDDLVEQDILDGRKGVEFIAINPMVRSAWGRYGVALAKRAQAQIPGSDGEDDQTIDRS